MALAGNECTLSSNRRKQGKSIYELKPLQNHTIIQRRSGGNHFQGSDAKTFGGIMDAQIQ